MKTKKLPFKKMTIANLASVRGGDEEIREEVETVDICTTVKVVVVEMPGLESVQQCDPAEPLIER